MATYDLAELGTKLETIERELRRLGLADQLTSTTIGPEDDPTDVADAVDAAAETTTTIPQLQDDVDEQGTAVSDLASVVSDAMDDLDARLDEAHASLELAAADIEEAQGAINDAFGARVDGLSDDVDTAITAAGSAQSEAEAANQAALAAAGLAASKGKTIVQVSAPTGANADPANLWINISLDSSGVPKNQPNRYNPDTAKWEPITDSQAVSAATAAANAAAAAQAAKDVADQANAAAGVAKTAADNANTAALQAAGIANGKGKVIYQASKPTGANAAAGNLWIRTSDNTPWAYDASIPDWVQVTDQTAKDAATAAVAAQQAATAAANAAATAQATADGKPLILFSTTASPSGTAPTGSIWFLWDTAKNIAGQWLQSGTLANPVWTPQQIRSEVIANLDVGKLTAGSAAIADLVAQKIAASTAKFQTVNVSNLFVTQGATLSQAVIDFLFANVVQAKKITAGMIDVSTLNGVTITGLNISSGSFQTTAAGYSGARTTISGGTVTFDNTKSAGTVSIYAPGAGLRLDASDGNGSSAKFDVLPGTGFPFTFYNNVRVIGASVSASDFQDASGMSLAHKDTDGWVVYAKDYRRPDGSSTSKMDALVVNPAAAVPVNGTTDVTARFPNASASGRVPANAWTTTDGFTVPAGMDGFWQLALSIRSVAGGQAFLQLNGTYVAFQDGTNATLNTPLYLSAGDKVRLFMFSTSSANSAQAATRFTAIRLGS